MTATLRTVSSVVAYGDMTQSNNPKLRYVDWSRDLTEELVDNPRSESHILTPGEEKLIFDGTRSTSIDGTSAFSLSLVSGTSDRYRFTWTAGTDPVFRSSRSFTVSGGTVTVVVNANNTATFTVSGGSFTGIQVGDTVWLPGPPDIVSSPFNVLNQGFWVVLAVNATTLTLSRPGDSFSAVGEGPISVTAAEQLQAYSAAGVQPGDKLEVTAGFSATALRNYQVVDVTNKYVEVESTVPLAAESGILPGAGGMLFFTTVKRWLRIEADQECVIRINGDTSSFQRLTPWLAGDPLKVGEYVKTGAVWSLKIFNRSPLPASISVISVE